ncbi:MAG: hypothetical protein HONBIEJF_03015 [Fimbriimonadaceae bacterium]|nr:hypothetical protein [Fimbriimonadaceae bacterium]
MKKKGLIVGVIGLVVIGGSVVGLGIAGVLNIPGLTPMKKAGKNLYGAGADVLYGEKKDAPPPLALKKPPAKKPEPEAPKPIPPKPDKIKGAKKIARVWNSLEALKVVEISRAWKDTELALVLSNMESEKAAQVLASMDAGRAGKLSQEIQKIAAQPPVVVAEGS